MPIRNPPPSFPVRTYPSPKISEQVLIEWVSVENASYSAIAPGTPHSNQREFSGFKLGAQRQNPLDHNFIQRIWVTDETSPDAYNFALKYSAESVTFPIFIRTYREPKISYAPRAKASALTGLYKLEVTDAGAGYIPGTFPNLNFDTGTGKGHAVVNQDGTIAEFVIDDEGDYATAPTFTVDTPAVGTAATGTAFVQPASAVLVHEEANLFPVDSEFYAQYFQVTRVYETLPGPILTQTVFDRDGILKTVTRQRMLSGDIVTDESLSAGVLTHKYAERDVDAIVGNQVVETLTVDDAGLLDLPAFTITIPNVISEIFRALIPTRVESHIVPGTAVQPTLGFGEFERSERQLTPLYKEVRFTVLDAVTLPISFVGYETDADKQVVTVTTTLELDTTTPTTPDDVTDVDFKKLGNGMAIETTRVVPEVFPRDSYTKSILNLIPEKLRATIATTESTIDSAGSPSTSPTLLTGELSRTETRLTAFTKRIRIVSLGAISVPVSVSGTETDRDKQVVTVVYTLRTAGTSTAVPSSVQDVSVEDLGNGYEVETTRIVPQVFAAGSYTKTILDLIPPELRAVIPMSESDETSAGTASTDPTLLTGEFSRNEIQVNEFNKRVRITSLGAVSVPVSITALDTDRDKQIVSIVYTLELAGTNSVVPTALIDVSVKDLGNGYEVVTTRTIPTVFAANTYVKSILNLIPENLRATISLVESDVRSSGTASTSPTLLTGELSRSETQESEFVKRIRITSLGSVSVPVSVSRTETNRDKQLVTIVDTLELSGTSAATITATQDVAVRDLGNGYEVQTVTTIPAVFAAGSYTKTIVDLIPPELRAQVPITESDITSSGTASTNPTLLTGELSRNEQQVSATTKRIRISSLGSVSVPVSITATETNRDKQVVSVVHTLRTAGTSVAVPTALIDVEVRQLGNGYEVETTKTIAAVFVANTYSISIINLIPPPFRAVVPTYDSDVTSAGTASTTPALLTGELERSETQVSAFVKRIRVKSFGSVSLPITLTGGQRIVEKYGLQLVADEVITLAATGTLTIPTGFLVIEADIKEIGGGMEIATSLVAAGGSWPVVMSSGFDEEMQIHYPIEEQVVAAAYVDVVGDFFVETHQNLDEWRAKRRRITKNPPAKSADTAIVSEIMAPFQFPGTLNAQQAALTNCNLGFRQTSAQLVSQFIRTWWVNSAAKPVIAFDEIFPDSITVSSVIGVPVQTFHHVLHDDWFQFGTAPQFFPATKPSYSEYYSGTSIGTALQSFVGVANVGTGYTPGDLLNVNDGHGTQVRVTAVGVSNSITAAIPVRVGTYIKAGVFGPFSSYGGSGSGAEFNVFVVSMPVYAPGTAWVGTPRVIAANVVKTEIPNLWKVFTRTVVMR